MLKHTCKTDPPNKCRFPAPNNATVKQGDVL